MSDYSLSGYLTALRLRSSRTVMLEGPTDGLVLERRCLEERRRRGQCQASIDTVDLIRDPSLLGGNRSKVIDVLAAAAADGAPLVGLVDREFDDFDLSSGILVDLRPEEALSGAVWFTRGHSIENYLLHPDYLLAYLCDHVPEAVPPGFDETLHGAIDVLVIEAAALSASTHSCGLMERCYGMLCVEHWERVGAHPRLVIAQLQAALEARGADVATSDQFAALLAANRERMASSEATARRWYMHGHIGSSVLWSGIAFLLSEAGVTGTTLEAVERGENKTKWRALASAWCRDLDNCGAQEGLHGLMAWLCGEEADVV